MATTTTGDDLLQWADRHHPEAARQTRAVAHRPEAYARYLARLSVLRTTRKDPPTLVDLTPAEEAELHALYARFTRLERQAWAATVRPPRDATRMGIP